MYYTDSYWVALLQADNERRAAYERAIHSSRSHANIAADIKAADTNFARRIKDASKQADLELANEAYQKMLATDAAERLAEPERLRRHREAEELARRSRA